MQASEMVGEAQVASISSTTADTGRSRLALPQVETVSSAYERFQIETAEASDVSAYPSQFRVKVRRHRLASMLVKEVFHYRNLKVVASRPCVYGVFGSPVGGFWALPRKCVGCLRCTIQYPRIVQISHNKKRQALGDSYFTFRHVDAITMESRQGQIPVRGAGYRGKFGGPGWDGMWTDMSEIVRPTRDGIHGREFISTSVDIGDKPTRLEFNAEGLPVGKVPQTIALEVPFLVDILPQQMRSRKLVDVVSSAATEAGTMVAIRVADIDRSTSGATNIVPVVRPGELGELSTLQFEPQLIELDGWDAEAAHRIGDSFPDALLGVRTTFGDPQALLDLHQKGVSVFHLTADYHGMHGGRFIIDLLQETHRALIEAGVRDRVTLIVSGGIIAAEHVPKALICGADAVAVDTPLLVAIQSLFRRETQDPAEARFKLPRRMKADWAQQRMVNMLSCWRDQLLEIMGAMGIREVRRMRGETGRAMFQKDLELEAFGGIDGYGE